MLAVLQLQSIRHDYLLVSSFGLCHTAAGNTVEQCTAAAELDLALVVLNDTLNSNGIATGNLLNTSTLQTVAGNGSVLITIHHDLNGDVLVFLIVGGLNVNNLTGQGSKISQMLAFAQLGNVAKDLDRIGGGLLSHTAAADTVGQYATGVKLDLVLVVLDDTLDGDHVVQSDLVNAGTLQAVAGDGITLCALNSDHGSDVVVIGIEGGLNVGDLTGQSNNVRQGLIVLQRISLLYDLQRIGGSVNSVALLPVLQDTAKVELDGAIVVLNGTGNGDDVTKVQILNAVTLQTVADDGILGVTLHFHGNGDVLVLGIIHGADGNNLTGQSYLVRQALTLGQCIGITQHLTHINCLGQDVVPGEGDGLAATVGDGCGQGIGSILLALFVDIDLDRLVLAGNDLDHILTQIYGPGDFEGLAAHTDHSITLVITRGRSCLVRTLIKRLQILHRRISGDVVVYRCRRVVFLGTAGVLTARKQREHQGQQQQP